MADAPTNGGVLFRWRLAVIVGFFVVACGVALPFLRPNDVATALANVFGKLVDPTSMLVGRDVAFVACGALSIIAFLLRTSGEARLGSVVYGQEASTHVVTGGPFRLLRHPLYAGTWLFFVATFAPWLPPLVVLLLAVPFALCLRSIALFEEAEFTAKLGDAWTKYAAAVPRFFGIPRAVDDDGVKTTPGAWARAALGNLALLSLGTYRILVASGVMFRGLRMLSLLCILVWIAVVVVRRLLRR